MVILALAAVAIATTLYEPLGKMAFRRLPVLRFIGYWPDDQEVVQWLLRRKTRGDSKQKEHYFHDEDLNTFLPKENLTLGEKLSEVWKWRVLHLRTVRIVWWHASKGNCPVYTRGMPRAYGYGEFCRPYRFQAWREGRETTLGHGMTEQGAIDHLRFAVQPDWTGELDGEGTPKGTMVFGNQFSNDDIVELNRTAFA